VLRSLEGAKGPTTEPPSATGKLVDVPNRGAAAHTVFYFRGKGGGVRENTGGQVEIAGGFC